MRASLSIEITQLAAQHIRKEEEWWRNNRPASRGAVREQVAEAFAIIAAQPNISPPATNVRLPDVRRIYLAKIRCHLYYHVIGPPERLEVIALWPARVGEDPPI